MSPTPTPTASRLPQRTTYSMLTRQAADRLHRARSMAAHPTSRGETSARDALAAHADLTSALVQLRRTLDASPAPQANPMGTLRGDASRRTPRTLRELERRARPRPWEVPRPTAGPAAPLAEAARLIRTAADLWATHQTADGRPRSLEGSQMRHPATLGAATREWGRLVALASEAAEATVSLCRLAGLPEDLLAPARDYPRPPDSASGPTDPIGLGLARPSVRVGRGLAELVDRIDRIRALAWSLSERGDAPVSVHRNIAVIGTVLNRAAADAHAKQCEAPRTGHLALATRLADGEHRDPSSVEAHRIAAGRADRAAELWESVSTLISPLRTTHPVFHPVQVERLDIERLLARLPREVDDPDQDVAAWTLSRLADSLAEVARFNAQALHAAHEAGELFMLGRGIPNHALPRRPDLVRARLTDALIPAPSAAVRQVEALYRDVWNAGLSRDREPAADGTP